MKKQIITLVLCLVAGVTFAQHHGGGKLDELKKEYFKEQLELTDAEAEKFFVMYDKYQEEKEILKMEQRLEFKKFQAKTNPTEDESKDFITRMILLQEKEVELLRRYTTDFEKIIGAERTAKLFIVEVEFKMKMIHEWKGRQDKEHEKAPMKQKGE